MGAGPLTIGCGGGAGATFPQTIDGLRQTRFVELSVDASTTAVAPAYATLLSRSIVTTGGALSILTTVALGALPADPLTDASIRVLLDGVAQRAAVEVVGAGINGTMAIVLLRRGAPAGSHIVRLQWARLSAAAATMLCFPVTLPNAHHASLQVQEVSP
jgi:hypothetical protein